MIAHASRSALNIAGGLLSTGMMCILGYLTWALVNYEIPARNESALLLLAGGILTQVGNTVNFFFGSSADNKKQAETISTLADTAKSAQAALAPASASTIPVGPGETVTVAGTDDASKT